MAGRPEEKYKPGELTKVKENLGKLSTEEAKKMSKVLGGEIGIEQTDQHIKDRYHELSNKIRNKDKWINQTQTVESISSNNKAVKTIKYSYLEKIKLYYLAAQPHHSIKTTKQTIRAIFDLLSKQKNYINYRLIESSNYYFYNSIKNLVESVRMISKNVPKKYFRREENPFYWTIIDTISDWEIESIQEEILNLKQDSKHITLDLCADLIKLIYIPIIRLSKINQKKDIEGAIKYIYKLSITGLFKKDLKIDRLRKSFTRGINEVNNVFKTIKYQLYPLLLMSVSSKVYDYNTMFKLKGHEILNFLELESNDLITYFENKDKLDTVNKQEENDSTEDKTLKIDTVLDPGIQQGIYFLNKMFPGSGWDILTENQDMYPYFKNILNLPNDAALISPEDSLQKIVILIALLKDMFYGFSNIEYGFLRNSDGRTSDLKDDMDRLIKNWYLYIDELIVKHYLSSLNEYCRYLESSTDFAETDYAKRIASDILWMKKKYICPNISLNLPVIMQPRTKTIIPKLYDSVSQLLVILERMVLEIFSRGELAIETLRNPENESQFEIENHVSRRIRSLLKEDKKKLKNSDLILYTYKIVIVLNDIIQTTELSAGENGISGLFRSEGSRGYKPIYSVSSDNTFFRIKDKKSKTAINPEDDTNSTDLITGFFGKNQLFPYLQQYIPNYKESKNTFSIIHINIPGFLTDSIENSTVLLKSAGKAITNSIRLLKDIPFRTGQDNIYILLPETDSTAALKVAERIFLNEYCKNKLFIGLTQYKSTMDEKQIITILNNTISKQLPTPGITWYDTDSGKYIQQSS